MGRSSFTTRSSRPKPTREARSSRTPVESSPSTLHTRSGATPRRGPRRGQTAHASDSSAPAFRPQGPAGTWGRGAGLRLSLPASQGWSEKECGHPEPKTGALGTPGCRLTSAYLVDGREIHGGANGRGEDADCRGAEIRL